MKGHIRNISKNSWQLQVYITGSDGKPRRHFETVRGHKADAQKRLNELLVDLEKGTAVPAGRLTVADQLHQWLAGYVATNCSQRTMDSYQSIVDRHLIPALGHIKLKHLNKQAIETYYGQAREKVSARTVHHFHRVLSQALRDAVIAGYLGSNPCSMITVKVPRLTVMRTMTPAELEALLERAVENHYYPVIYTAVSTGLRQAELLGLRWRDLDLDKRSISVSQVLYKRRGICEFKEPKTAHSRRRVAMTKNLQLFLKKYLEERQLLCLELDKILSLDDLVFANVEGKPLDPGVLSHDFARIVKRAGLRGVRFHDLRHTFASLMLLQGVNVKVISEALGHASVAFTMDIYSHILPGMQEDAMERLGEVVPAGINGQSYNAELTQNPPKTGEDN